MHIMKAYIFLYLHDDICVLSLDGEIRPLREIPDHATFRRKGENTGLVRQTWAGMFLFGPM